MKTAKQETQELLDRLPDDVSMDDLLHALKFKASVLRGLEQAERGEGITTEELKDRLRGWRESSGRQRRSGT